jgi:ribosomal protein L33
MAKAATIIVQMVNEEHTTPTKYLAHVSTKGPNASNKLRLRKYDPVVKKHCWFVQRKLPSPKAK